jgi:hypothetical protein
MPTASEEKKRPIPKSNGRLRKPACTRCVKTGRACEEQAGFAKACVHCATIKMRCDDAEEIASDDEVEVPKRRVRVMDPQEAASQKRPVDAEPAASQVPSKRPAPASSQRPSKKPAPAPATKHEEVGKIRRPKDETFRDLKTQAGKTFVPFPNIYSYIRL